MVFGGLSSERDISLKSGHCVSEALIKEGLDIQEIGLSTEDPEEVEQIIKDYAVNIIFIAMHGRFGEDGKLQAVLEKIGMAYIGSDSLASAFAMDKIVSRSIFKDHNIPIANGIIINKYQKDNLKKENLFFPLVVKPKSQGSSIGVSFVKDINQMNNALELAFEYDDNVIIEEYIKGRELTVGILDNQAFEPIEILPKNDFFDFQAKYNKGLTDYILPVSLEVDLKKKMQRLALRAHRALGCRHFSRVDIILDKDNNPFVLEVNTIPGFTSTSLLPKAAFYEGITFGQLCIRLLKLAARDSFVLSAAEESVK